MRNDYFFILDKFFDDFGCKIINPNTIQKKRWFDSKEQDDKQILMYDVAGINEDDLKVSFSNDGYRGVITISGETKTDYGDFDCGIRFYLNTNSVGQDSSYYIKNGILYVEVVPDGKNKFEIKKKVE